MTNIGPFSVAKPFASAIAYELNAKPTQSGTIALASGWEIVCDPMSKMLVARTKASLSRDDIVPEGFEALQQGLDLLSARFHNHLRLGKLTNYISLFDDNGHRVVKVVGEFDFPMRVNLTIVCQDAHGNIIPQERRSEPQWHPSFRFYRFAETTDDPFDAYRNIFLALELLLSELVPKQKNERERPWLLRALGEASKRASLSGFAPEGHKEPNSYIVGTQYDAIRCRLFHAKAEAGDLALPHHEPSVFIVRQRYMELARLWRHLAAVFLNLDSGGGVITNIGFRNRMDRALSSIQCFRSSDPRSPQPASKADDAILFSANVYDSEVAPGVVGFHSFTNIVEPSKIHRIDVAIPTQTEEVLFGFSYFEDGFGLDEGDRLEFWGRVSLVNHGQPGNLL